MKRSLARGGTLLLAGALSVPSLLAAPPMPRARVNGVELEYASSGKGAPVLFIHGAILADAFAPLVGEPALKKYRLVRYNRRGFAGSSRAQPPFSIAQQAADARALLDHLGIRRAHVVGHSYGAVIALQLALDAPDKVRSLALLEPPLMGSVPSGPQFGQAMAPVFTAYGKGDKAGAIDEFLVVVTGPDSRAGITRALGAGALDLAVTDADTFFQVEGPALQEWSFTPEMALRIKVPVLRVVGAASAAPFKEGHEVLKQWFPRADGLVVPGVNHALQMMDARAGAEGLAAFYRSPRR